LFLALSITLDPGEQVLVPDPCFSMYAELPRLLNARPVRYPVYPDFKVSVEKLMPFITEKTKAILINSPANPTGAVIDQTALYEIVNFARERNLWVIYDELYDEFVYGVAHAKLSLGYDQSIIINSFSKSHGVPGWRVGFVVASKQAFRAMLKVQQNSIVCAPAPSQYGALLAYEFDHARVRKDYGARRDFVYNELSNKFSLVKPDGAFFAFPEAPGGDASAFCDRCLKHKLLVIPGSVFSEQDTHFRICFSAPKATLEKGVEILLSLV